MGFNKNLKRKIILINGIFLFISLMILIAMYSELSPFKFSMTGYSFAEFYDSEIMYTLNAFSGEETAFIIPVINNKNSELKNVLAKIEIYNKDNKKITELETNKIDLMPYEENQIKTFWKNNLLTGHYIARIHLSSKESNANFVKGFKIEEKTITIESIFLKDSELGQSIALEVVVQNHLDKYINTTRANLIIYDEKRKVIANVSSEPVNINKNSIARIPLFLNTKNLKDSEYDGKIIISNKDDLVERNIVLNIDDNEVNVLGVGFAINYRHQKEKDLFFFIVIILFFLIGINFLIWYIYLKRKRNR